MTAASLGHLPPLPSLPADWPRVPLRLPSLAECIVLALLLHALVLLVLGSAPGGSAQPGEGVYGALNIRLAGSGVPGPDGAATPAPPAAYTGPQGSADERRWGGAVRDTPAAPKADSEPGAARPGTWSPVATPEAADPLPAATAPLPALEPAAPAVPELAPLPAAGQPVAPVAPITPIAPVTPSEAVPELAALPAPTRSLPTSAPPPLPIDRPLNRVAPVESLAVPAPGVPALAPLPSAVRNLPATAPQPLPLQRPLNRVAPVEAVAAPAPPLPALAPAPAAVRNLPTAAPQALPVDSPALNRVAPAEPVSLPAAPPAVPALNSLPEARPGADAQGPAAAAPSLLPPAGAGAAAGGTPHATQGAPDAGAVVGHDVATAPSSPASAPRLNLDLPRPRGGEISRQGSRGLLNLVPHPPDSKLANDIEKSAKPDCRTAYSGMGLLAVVPLAADAVRKDGCRW